MGLLAERTPVPCTLQARRIWEAVLYAQPKVRTDEGLASLAQLVRTLAVNTLFIPVWNIRL